MCLCEKSLIALIVHALFWYRWLVVDMFLPACLACMWHTCVCGPRCSQPLPTLPLSTTFCATMLPSRSQRSRCCFLLASTTPPMASHARSPTSAFLPSRSLHVEGYHVCVCVRVCACVCVCVRVCVCVMCVACLCRDSFCAFAFFFCSLARTCTLSRFVRVRMVQGQSRAWLTAPSQP